MTTSTLIRILLVDDHSVLRAGLRMLLNSQVLILTMHDDVSYLRQVLRKGASGYVLKKAADSELLNAIAAVMRGEIYIHPAMTGALVKDLVPDMQPHRGAGADIDLWQTLSEREREVLQRVARGHTNSEIATQLSLSVKTVETYRARGMEKLGLRTRAQLMHAALEKGLLE
jgi:DNA-binding NarL/FixJ family response regulator